jgi:hypothetical protein
MKTITLGKTRYTVRDDRIDIMAAHAKCTGKHKVVKSKGAEKRIYPQHWAGDSTADYVAAYEAANHAKHLAAWDWQALRAEPCLLPVGEDAAWEVEYASDL